MRILLVEDDAMVSTMVIKALIQEGHNLTLAVDGLDGMDKFKSDPFIELVITDYNMPDFNGAELAEFIKNRDKEIPVVMITGFSSEFSRLEAYSLGIDFYMEKPLDLADLVQLIKIFEPISCSECKSSGKPTE